MRKDIYGHDALAWAIHANGKVADAVGPMMEALRLGTRDAKLFFHAGMIFYRLGDIEKATHYLERALATNPHFHLLQADVARATLKELESSSRRAGREKGQDS